MTLFNSLILFILAHNTKTVVPPHGSPAPGSYQDLGSYPPVPLQEAKANWHADSLLSIEKTVSRKKAIIDADHHNGPKSSKLAIC